MQEKQARENYEAMMTVARKNIVPNDEEFECPICFVPIEVGEGVKLRECLHNCCRLVYFELCNARAVLSGVWC